MTRILIVDDAAFMRKAIRTILEKHGFEIVGEAQDGIEGLVKYKETKPDIVTMDITMPMQNGVESLKAIRQYDMNAKVVMISAMGQESIVMDAVMNGAKSFIIKPFKEDHVLKTLAQVAAM